MIGERVGRQRWLGLTLGLAGSVLVIYAHARIEVTSLLGVGYAGVALVCMTLATLLEKRFGAPAHPLSANLAQYAVGMAVVLPLAWLLEPMRVDWQPEFVWSVAYLAIGSSIIAITLLLAMIRAGEASRVSALLFLVPPTAALIAYLVIGEAMPPLAWLGMLVAGIGVAIATMTRQAPGP
jgi:drug/metabolite transporter (DMT)-like permease